MFCSNCGKELPSDAKICGHCGMMVKSETGNTNDFNEQNNSNAYNTQYSNTAYQQGINQAQNGYTDPVKSYQPNNTKRLWNKNIIIAISAAAVAVIIGCTIFSAYSAFKAGKHHNDIAIQPFNGGGNYGEYYGNGDNYGNDGDMFGGYGDIFGNDGGYGYPGGGYGNPGGNSGGNSGGSSGGGYGNYGQPDTNNPNNSGGNGSQGQISDPLPTDRNGNSASSGNYEWPTGDGTYEFYTKSTIPKFESVTGKQCKTTENDNNGNIYYKYDMDMDAYNNYLEALKKAGYSQSKFDVQNKDSYVMYENGNQYLIIYLMNSENQIVIMA